MAKLFNDFIDRGSIYRLTLEDQLEDETPTNLEGCTAELQLRTDADATTSAVTLTSDPAAGITITPGTGRIDIELTHVQTALLTADSYVWAIELTWGNGAKERLAEGVFTPTAEVVR